MVLRINLLSGAAFVPPSLCSIDGDGGDGGSGGDSGADAGGAAAALAAAAGGAGGDGGDGGEGGGDGGADPEWLQSFSADGGSAEDPSNRDYLKAKGFKSLDDVAKSLRETEKAFRSGGKLTVPGENATPEEIAAFRTAIGVPEKPEGYEVKPPDGSELDAGFLDPMKGIALEAGVPAAAFGKLAEGFMAWQQDQVTAMKTAEDGSAQEWMNAQGAQKDARMASVNQAMRALDLTGADIAGMQQGLAMVHGKPGSARVLDLLAKLGDGMAEDAILGGGKKRFGITAAEARAEVDRLVVDKDFQKKLTDKDPDAVARWTRLNGAIAADVDRQNKEEAAAA